MNNSVTIAYRFELHFNATSLDGLKSKKLMVESGGGDGGLKEYLVSWQALQEDTQLPQTSMPIPNVADEAIFKEWDDRVVRATTTAASLDTAQASGVNTPGSDEERLKQHELTDNVPPTPHNLPLLGGHTPGSDEGRLKQDKLMDIVTALSQKKSKSKRRRLTLVTSEDETYLVVEDPSKQGRSLIEEIDLDSGISLVPPHVEVQGRYGQNIETQEGFGDGQEVSTAAQVLTVSTFVSTASPQRNANTTADDLTPAETLMEIRKSAAKDKGKAKMDETESSRKMKWRERVQISRDEEVAQKLQEEFDEAERQRMAQVHQATQGFTDSDWDDVLARVAADEDFVQQLQEGEKCSEEDLPMKFVELVKDIFETTMRRVQSFVPIGSELEVQRLKRAGQEVLEKPVKRQKIGEASGSGEEQSAEKEKELSEEELQKLLVIVPMEELVIQPLQVSGNHTEAYQIFADMLKKFNRDDLVKLWDLVKERFSTTEPTYDKEKELWVELKRLFEPNKDDILWKLQRYMHDPLVWRLYDTCGVHHVSSVRGHDIFMLVKKEYPLTKGTLRFMMVARLLVKADSEMSRELLRKIFYQENRPRQ
ncbi:hypothetical protein Tco_0582492 [Tanacetum coccineum]